MGIKCLVNHGRRSAIWIWKIGGRGFRWVARNRVTVTVIYWIFKLLIEIIRFFRDR
jgi:hypothetical protein